MFESFINFFKGSGMVMSIFLFVIFAVGVIGGIQDGIEQHSFRPVIDATLGEIFLIDHEIKSNMNILLSREQLQTQSPELFTDSYFTQVVKTIWTNIVVLGVIFYVFWRLGQYIGGWYAESPVYDFLAFVVLIALFTISMSLYTYTVVGEGQFPPFQGVISAITNMGAIFDVPSVSVSFAGDNLQNVTNMTQSLNTSIVSNITGGT